MFKQARMKLTAWYLLIIMSISISFSIVIFQQLSLEVERFERLQRFRLEKRFQEYYVLPPINHSSLIILPDTYNPELIWETKQRMVFVLFGVNLIILILSGGLGYFLAGKTLLPIKKMVDEQNRFISDASHELKTPLTSLKTAFEVYLLDKNKRLDDANLIIKESIDEVEKLQTLSESLLDLARYQKPHQETEMKIVNLYEIINLAVKKITLLAKKKNQIIKAETFKVGILGNKENLTDLFVILLENAVKYSPNNKIIRVIFKRENKQIAIIVKDEGIGIAKNDLAKIFERFYRANTARTKDGSGGYGLGLSIAKKIIETHNGSIEVNSKKNSGSEFIVKLPKPLKKPSPTLKTDSELLSSALKTPTKQSL